MATKKEEFNLHLFIQHSNLVDLQYALDGITVVPGLSPGDLMYDNQKKTWEWLVSQEKGYAPPTLFKDIHRMLTSGVDIFEHYQSSGVYRTVPIYIEREEKEFSKNIQTMCEDFLMHEIQITLSRKKITKIEANEFSWWAHNVFECIHPFIDGNGRSGRLLLNYIRHQLSLPLVYILNINPPGKLEQSPYYMSKFDYYNMLKEFDKKYKQIRREHLRLVDGYVPDNYGQPRISQRDLNFLINYVNNPLPKGRGF